MSVRALATESAVDAVCVAVCCSVLQCVAVCCSVLQRVAVGCSALQCVAVRCCVLQRAHDLASESEVGALVLQLCCSCVAGLRWVLLYCMLQCSFVVRCSLRMQCVVMCCSVSLHVLQCVAPVLFYDVLQS